MRKIGKKYPSDLTDEEWKIIEPFIPEPKTGGSPVKYEKKRDIQRHFIYNLDQGAHEGCFQIIFHIGRVFITISVNGRKLGLSRG